MSKIFLIDAYGFVFRAYYSLLSMTTAGGQPIGALFGFCNMILKILRDFSPENIMIIFDHGKKNFRHALNDSYKKNRSEAPDDLRCQFQLIREFINVMNLSNWEAIGFEADDLIATIAKQAKQSEWQTIVISSDKDLMQLIDEDLQMFDPVKNKNIDSNAVFEKFGVMPEKMLDFLTMVGDASDNIQGVNGIGPKTAAKLLKEWNNLDEILKNNHIISSKKIAQNLEKSKEYIENSRNLIKLADDVPIPNQNWQAWSKIQKPEFQKLFIFLQEYNFNSIIQKIEQLFSIKHDDFREKIATNEINIEQENDLKKLIILLESQLQIFLDFQEDVIIIAVQNYEIYTINLIKLNNVIEILTPILENSTICKIFLNGKKNLAILKNSHIDIGNSYEDLFSMLYCISCGQFEINIENIRKRYFPQSNLQCFFHIFAILPKIFLDLQKSQTLEIYSIEKQICKVLVNMETNGIIINPQILKNLLQKFSIQKDKLSQDIFQLAGEDFNIGSPKQIGYILFEKMQLPEGKKSKSGIFITDFDALNYLKIQGFEIAEKILQWRHLDKLNQTYLNGLLQAQNENHKIHSTYSNISTITGRLTSRDPNLQNLPVKTKDGREIRGAFVASPGKIFISADYSQIELRILAEMAQVKKLQLAFNNDQDIHEITAKEIFEIETVSRDCRRKAKSINFGIIYGLSAFGLAKQLEIKIEEAKLYIEKYFEKYPEIHIYMKKTIEFAQKNHFVRTKLGRKCFIKEIKSINHNLQSAAQRSAINAPIQGTAADIIKIAMNKIVAKIDNKKAKLLMQIHDELVFEVIPENLDEIQKIIRHEMQNIVQIQNLQLKVNLKSGNNLLLNKL